MSSRWSDLARPPLRVEQLRRGLTGPGGGWAGLSVVESTGSTNADLVAAAVAGAPHGSVLVAEHQTGGRGRRARVWASPPRAGLTFSVLLRPGVAVPRERWGWVPLLGGVAVAAALREGAEVDARLKWPNDVLVDGRKVAGLLAEVAGTAVVLGVGLNVTTRRGELPEGATSLALAGAAVLDRDPLLRAVLRAVAERFAAWRARGGDDPSLREAYRSACVTLGSEVAVELPGTAAPVRGRAAAVDDDGRLVLATAAGPLVVAAGDVVHLRAGG